MCRLFLVVVPYFLFIEICDSVAAPFEARRYETQLFTFVRTAEATLRIHTGTEANQILISYSHANQKRLSVDLQDKQIMKIGEKNRML